MKTMPGGKMLMREGTEVENPKKDNAETQTRKPEERERSTRNKRLQETDEMKTRKTNMKTKGKRAHSTGEVIGNWMEEMRGTKRREKIEKE